MAGRTFTAADLESLVAGLRVVQAGAQSSRVALELQMDVLLERIAALTHALRTPGENEAVRVACRLLLSDIALVAAQLRGGTSEHAALLTQAIEGIRALDRADRP
jgi:hypothetical protein